VVSTVAIAVSSIVTTLIIVVGVILINPAYPRAAGRGFAACLRSAGAGPVRRFGVVFISRNWKIAVARSFSCYTFHIYTALNAGTVGIMVPVSVLFTLGVSRLMYKKGMLD
jgi:hypothetical protein